MRIVALADTPAPLGSVTARRALSCRPAPIRVLRPPCPRRTAATGQALLCARGDEALEMRAVGGVQVHRRGLRKPRHERGPRAASSPRAAPRAAPSRAAVTLGNRQGLDGEKQYARAPLPLGRTGAGGSGASAYRPPPRRPLRRTRIDARRAHRMVAREATARARSGTARMGRPHRVSATHFPARAIRSRSPSPSPSRRTGPPARPDDAPDARAQRVFEPLLGIARTLCVTAPVLVGESGFEANRLCGAGLVHHVASEEGANHWHRARRRRGIPKRDSRGSDWPRARECFYDLVIGARE